jgi:very-short-patch-repair endonuclease
MRERTDPRMLGAARENRARMTREEALLWSRLRRGALGAHFRRQHPIGPYIADFACLRPGLVVEADGSQHQESEYDRVRDAFIRSQGFVVMRFWNDDVWCQVDDVVREIRKQIVEMSDPASWV